MSDAFVSAFFRLTAYFAIAVVCGLALALIDHPLAPLMFAVAFFAMGALHDIYREETMALIHDLHRENKRLESAGAHAADEGHHKGGRAMSEELDRLDSLLAQATPGPWLVRAERHRFIHVYAGGGGIAHMDQTDGEAAANARLTVELHNAAPRLLAAAREAEEWKAKALRWDAERQIIGGHCEDLRAALHRTEAEVKELQALTRDLLARVKP